MLSDTFLDDLKTALKAGDALKLSTLRLLISEIKNETIKSGQELNDQAVQKVIAREIKKREDSKNQFTNAGRAEQAKKEDDEIKILARYLPEQLSDEELSKIVWQAVAETNSSEAKDIGKVIGQVMGQIEGRATGQRVGDLVRKALNL